MVGMNLYVATVRFILLDEETSSHLSTLLKDCATVWVIVGFPVPAMPFNQNTHFLSNDLARLEIF